MTIKVSIAQRKIYNKSLYILPSIRISMHFKFFRDCNFSKNDMFSMAIIDDVMEIKYCEPLASIPLGAPISRCKPTLSYTINRVPELANYNFPTNSVKLGAFIKDGKLCIDISRFHKEKGSVTLPGLPKFTPKTLPIMKKGFGLYKEQTNG